MNKKFWGITRSTWIVVICNLPVALMIANGWLFNRRNIAAEDAFKPYVYTLFGVCLVFVIVMSSRWRKEEENEARDDSMRS